MSTNLKKENSSIVVKEEKQTWRELMAFRRENEKWLEKSSNIATTIFFKLKDLGKSQKWLADQLNVSSQQVSKIMKGKENLTLQTVSNIEEVLGGQLMSTVNIEEVVIDEVVTEEVVSEEVIIAEVAIKEVISETDMVDNDFSYNKEKILSSLKDYLMNSGLSTIANTGTGYQDDFEHLQTVAAQCNEFATAA
jgi:transcriptional regulator with XRE-family HTH domain